MNDAKGEWMPTIQIQVSASHDDAGAWWDWKGFYWPWTLDKSHVSVGLVTDRYDGGLRFTNVDIPRGAKIISATLRLCSGQTCAGTGARWNIYGQNTGNCDEFSTKDEFLGRPKTNAMVDTDFLPPWVEGSWYDVTGLAQIIQEIVNRSDWNAGNSLALLLYGHPEARTTHEIRSYDANPNEAAILEVSYEGEVAEHTLKVESSLITGVPVRVDGTEVGLTPITLTVQEGNHIIEVPQEIDV